MASLFGIDISVISLLFSVISITLAVIVTVALSLLRKTIPKGENANSQIDAIALVQEFRKRNEAMEEKLVDLRVRVEILDLRVSRMIGREPLKQSPQSIGTEMPKETKGRAQLSSSTFLERPITIDPIRREILSAVRDANGAATSRDIQAKIGKSREHVARTMNMLQKQGLLHRNQETRPFSYSITQEGENELSNTL
jgi:predicted transcriptional regulator